MCEGVKKVGDALLPHWGGTVPGKEIWCLKKVGPFCRAPRVALKVVLTQATRHVGAEVDVRGIVVFVGTGRLFRGRGVGAVLILLVGGNTGVIAAAVRSIRKIHLTTCREVELGLCVWERRRR